nr:ABC transporter permease [uncultured Helicobacter sp.]
MIFNAFLLAFRQIRRNFLRAFLTMLGVIIGVGAVVVMISIGNGTTKMITDRISSLGSNLLLVFPARAMNPSGANLRRNFSLQEAQRLQTLTQDYIQAIAPISQSSVVLQFQSQNTTTQAQGVTEGFFEVTQWDSSEGRGFEENEYRVGSNVCLIGESVKKNLFSSSNPLGQKIRLNNIVCECIGVLESKGQGGMGNDQDDVILLPMKAFLRSVSGNNSLFFVNRIMLRAKDNVDSNEMLPALSKALREVRNVRVGERDSFEIMDTKQIEQTLTSTTQMLTGLLGMIAGVSLIVGGIGIMNIMLVSVTERTKEIGTRMAIGALQSEVLMQFLIESVTLSSCGGLIGIVWAFFASLGLSYYMEIPFIFDVPTAIIAFLFSAFIGILFGYLPARRASKLNPIDALRHE